MRVITVFLMLMMSMVTMASQLNDTIIVVQDSAKIAKEEEAKKKVHQYRYRVEHLMLSDLLDRFNNRKIVVDAFVDFDWMKENLEKMDSTFVFEWDKMSYEIRKKGIGNWGYEKKSIGNGVIRIDAVKCIYRTGGAINGNRSWTAWSIYNSCGAEVLSGAELILWI